MATPRRSRKVGRGKLSSLGVFAAARRQELRLTQPELAELAGLSVATVNAVEAGKGTLRLDSLTAALDALGLELVVVTKPTAARLAREGTATRLTQQDER